MGPGVFVLRDETTLVPMQVASFATEDDFQRLLAAFPELLAGDQIDAEAPRRFVLVAREQGIADEEGGSDRWSLDHLFLDQDGVPTLVEVKRGTDTRIRREVVGQMLDYAANAILHWPLATLRARFGARCQEDGRDPNEVVASLIGPDRDREDFWADVGANLQAGRIRLLFVADRIPPELRRVVEFLNRQMQPAEVLAVELRQYEGQGLKTLVPLVLGQTQEATTKKAGGATRSTGPKRVWDAASIVSEIEAKHGAEPARVAEAIFAWCRDRADQVRFNDRQDWGWFSPVFRRDHVDYEPFRVWTDGSVAITFQYLLETPLFASEDRRRAMLGRFNAIPGVRLSETALTRRKHVQLTVLAAPGALDAFLAIMNGFVATLDASTGNNDPGPMTPV